MTSLPSTIAHLRLSLAQERARWLRPLLVVAVLTLSVALPRLVSGRAIWLLLGLPFGVAALLLVLRWPPLGLVGLIVASLLVPFTIGTGSNTNVNVTILILGVLVGLWLLDMVAIRRQMRLVSSRTLTPLLVLMLAAALAFVVGQLPWFPFTRQTAPLPAQLGGLATFVFSGAAFLLVAHQVRDLRWLEWLTWVFLALGALYLAGYLLPQVGRFLGGLLQHTVRFGSMFWTWLVALAFSQAVLNKKLHPAWRVALAGLVAAALYFGFILNSGWKAGYIPPLVAMAAIIALSSWRAGVALAIVGTIPAVALLSQAVATDQYSYSTRIDAWLIMLEIIRLNPILGFGPANYYWYTQLFPIRGYYVPFNAHSQYVDIVAQTGLLGLTAFLWFFFEVGRVGWGLRKKVPEGFARAYVYGALGGLAGTLAAGVLVDWIIPFVYNVGLKGMRASILAWIFLGGLVSLEGMLRNRESSSPPLV